MAEEFEFTPVETPDLLERTETVFYRCFDCSPLSGYDLRLCPDCAHREEEFHIMGATRKPIGCALPREDFQRSYLTYIQQVKTGSNENWDALWTEEDLNKEFPSRNDITPNLARRPVRPPVSSSERTVTIVQRLAPKPANKAPSRFERTVEFSEKEPEVITPSREKPVTVSEATIAGYLSRLRSSTAKAVAKIFSKGFETPSRFEKINWDKD